MKTLFAALMLTVALAVAPTAGANPPSVGTSAFSYDYVSSGTCGFPLHNVGSVAIVQTTFSGVSGVPVRLQMRVRADGTMTGPNGRVATITSTVTQTTDLATGIMAVDGTLTDIRAPGVGMLLHDAGQTVQDTSVYPPEMLSMSGLHPGFGVEEWAPVCDYLAGP